MQSEHKGHSKSCSKLKRGGKKKQENYFFKFSCHLNFSGNLFVLMLPKTLTCLYLLISSYLWYQALSLTEKSQPVHVLSSCTKITL